MRNYGRMFLRVGLFAAVACLPAMQVAYAQNAESLIKSERADFDEQVGELALPAEYMAQGRMFRGFLIKPELEIQTRYDSNVYREHRGGQSDAIVAFKPALTLQKSYGGLDLALRAHGNIERYKSLSDENKEELFVGFGGYYDVNSRWAFPFSTHYSRTYKDRGSPQISTSLDSPVSLDQANYSAGFIRTFNRLSIEMMGKYRTFKFEDGITLGDPRMPVVYSDNDRTAIGGNVRFKYMFPRNETGKSGHMVFLDLDTQKHTYDRGVYDGGRFTGLKKDHMAHNVTLGFATTYKGILQASLGAGILSRQYDDSRLKNVDSLDVMANVKYAFRPRLVFDFKADRYFSEFSDSQSGVIETEYELGADFELKHNIFWRNAFTYKTYDFAEVDRFDTDYKLETGLKYYMNQNIYTQLGLSYQDRQSNETGRDFDRTQLMLSVVSRL